VVGVLDADCPTAASVLSGAQTAWPVYCGARMSPEGVSWCDWERAARAEDATRSVTALRCLGPEVAPGQMLLVLDEVLTPAPSSLPTSPWPGVLGPPSSSEMAALIVFRKGERPLSAPLGHQ